MSGQDEKTQQCSDPSKAVTFELASFNRSTLLKFAFNVFEFATNRPVPSVSSTAAVYPDDPVLLTLLQSVNLPLLTRPLKGARTALCNCADLTAGNSAAHVLLGLPLNVREDAFFYWCRRSRGNPLALATGRSLTCLDGIAHQLWLLRRRTILLHLAMMFTILQQQQQQHEQQQ